MANAGGQWLFDLETDPGELTNRVKEPFHSEAHEALRLELLRRTFDTDRQNLNRTGDY